jgi:FHS family L-fucose permease-like MFS transporter
MGALRYKQLVFGMIAIFMYVGAEVSIGSILINFMNDKFAIAEMEAKSFLAFYWGGAMIGRFLGAISMGEIKDIIKKYLLMFIVSIAVFFVIFGVVWIESDFTFSFSKVLPYIGFMLLNLLAFRLGKGIPGKTLMVFAMVNVVLLIIALTGSGQMILWSLLSIGLFNSIMWSNIFTLAIDKLGKYTSQGSSLLVMMILGGAIIPIIQGIFADKYGVHFSFIVPILSYVYLVYYGWRGYKPGKI